MNIPISASTQLFYNHSREFAFFYIALHCERALSLHKWLAMGKHLPPDEYSVKLEPIRQYRWCERMSYEYVWNDKQCHKLAVEKLWCQSVDSRGNGFHVSNVSALWWLLSRSHCVLLRNYLPPLNISCKMRIATFEKLVASVTDGAGGPKQAMNLRLMSRLISERATSALTINLFPSSPVDIWHMHQQTHEWKWIEPSQGKNTHAHTHTHTCMQFQRQCYTFRASWQDTRLAASCL